MYILLFLISYTSNFFTKRMTNWSNSVEKKRWILILSNSLIKFPPQYNVDHRPYFVSESLECSTKCTYYNYIYLFVCLHVIKLISIYNFVQPIAVRANSSEFATWQCQFFRGGGNMPAKTGIYPCRVRSSFRARGNETRYKCKTLRLR